MAFTTINSTQTDAKSPIDEQLMDTGVRLNFDDHESRLGTVESEVGVVDFADERFEDGVVKADDKILGYGNTGLTSTASTNPRGLSFGDLKAVLGVERVYFGRLVEKPEEFKDRGIPVYGIEGDDRVRFVGIWHERCSESYYTTAIATIDPNAYVEFTGVFDSIFPMIHAETSGTIDFSIDGVSVSTNVNATNNSVGILQDVKFKNKTIYDSNLKGLGQDIHTLKIERNSAGTNPLIVFGVNVVSSSTYQELGGKAFIRKQLVSFPKSTLTLPTVTEKGGRSVRYLKRSDNTIAWATNNIETGETTTSGALTGGSSSSVVVGDGSGFQAGSIAYFVEGSTFEFILINSVSTNTLNFSGTIVNSFSSGVVVMNYGNTSVASDLTYSNEELYLTVNPKQSSCETDASEESFGLTNSTNKIDADSTLDYNCVNFSCYQALAGLTTDGRAVVKVDNTTVGDFLISFYGTGLGVLVFVGSAASNNVNFYVDGVNIGTPTITTLSAEYVYYTVASNLDVGFHKVVFEKDNTDSTSFNIVKCDIYMPKLPSELDSLRDGSKLMDLYQPGQYIDVPTTLRLEGAPRGTHRLSPNEGWVFNTPGGAASPFVLTGTNSASSLPPFYISGQNDGITDNEPSVSFGFFGTGFGLFVNTKNSNGIINITVNGNALTTANFGSLTVYATTASSFSSSAFNTSTGALDLYTSTTNYNYISFTGLGLDYHNVEIDIDLTKNASSSNRNCEIFCADVIGAPGLNYKAGHNTVRTIGYTTGSINDTRVFKDSLTPFKKTNRSVILQSYLDSAAMESISSCSTVTYATFPGFCAGFNTNGGNISIRGNLYLFNNGSDVDITIGIIIDGKEITNRGGAGNESNLASMSHLHKTITTTVGQMVVNIPSIPLSKGGHFISVEFKTGGTSAATIKMGQKSFIEVIEEF